MASFLSERDNNMKTVFSEYDFEIKKLAKKLAKHSSICNPSDLISKQGLCPMHQIKDIIHQRTLEFRCPRQPFIGKELHYVKHI